MRFLSRAHQTPILHQLFLMHVVFAIRWLLEVDARELEQANMRARDLIAVVLDALAFINMFRYEEYA